MKRLQIVALALCASISTTNAFPLADSLCLVCPAFFEHSLRCIQAGRQDLAVARDAEKGLEESEATFSTEEGIGNIDSGRQPYIRTPEYVQRKRRCGYFSIAMGTLMGLSVCYSTYSFASFAYHGHNK